MNRTWWLKLITLLAFVGIATAYVLPTIAQLDPEKTHFPVKKKVNLGLDLQGGLYMVYGIDFEKVYREIMDRQMLSLQQYLKREQPTAILKDVAVSADTGGEVHDPRARFGLFRGRSRTGLRGYQEIHGAATGGGGARCLHPRPEP